MHLTCLEAAASSLTRVRDSTVSTGVFAVSMQTYHAEDKE